MKNIKRSIIGYKKDYIHARSLEIQLHFNKELNQKLIQLTNLYNELKQLRLKVTENNTNSQQENEVIFKEYEDLVISFAKLQKDHANKQQEFFEKKTLLDKRISKEKETQKKLILKKKSLASELLNKISKQMIILKDDL